MPTYYVGPGGNDGNNGLTWAQRKLTLNGAEDVPVAAGDVCYIGPGVYRESLTVDVSGNAGNPITYIADVTGEHTDSVGGIVRVTGSDNDTTATRTQCILANGIDYRTFRGFALDLANTYAMRAIAGPENWIIEDCTFQSCLRAISLEAGPLNIEIRRCWFMSNPATDGQIHITAGATYNDCGITIENCVFLQQQTFHDNIHIERAGDGIVRNCLFLAAGDDHIDVNVSPNAGHGWDVNNCTFVGARGAALEGAAIGDIIEDYNTFWSNIADRTNTDTGANSVAYPPLLAMPILHAGASQVSGFRFPWWFGDLSEWSQIRAITGSNEADEDLWGIQRPVARGKRSWGACQFQDVERETTTTRGASAASLGQREPARQQMWVPTSNVQTTISTYVYREPGYASITNPQMIIKQPGVGDRTTTDAGAASAWNLLTDTFTPAADPPYVIVELASHHQATSTSVSTSTSTSTTSTSTSFTGTSTSTSTTSTSVSTTSISTSTTSTSTSTTTLAYDVYFDDLGVS